MVSVIKITIAVDMCKLNSRTGDIHTAFQDANMALSPQYSLPDSPKGVTMKCYFRRAKLLCMFSRYNDALSDFEIFEKLRFETNTAESTEDQCLKNDIDEGLRAMGGCDRQRKDELIRAVDVCVSDPISSLYI